MTKRPDWTRPLPASLVIPKVMTLKTLADVRELIEHHLPKETREKVTWEYLARLLAEASRGADTVDVAVVLRMVLGFEGVEYRLK